MGHPLDQLSDRILCQLLCDLGCVWCATNQSVDHVTSLREGDLRRQRRFVGVYGSLDQRGPRFRKGLRENPLALIGICNGIATDATGSSHAGIVDGLKIATVFRIPKEGHLLPFDLTKTVVLQN